MTVISGRKPGIAWHQHVHIAELINTWATKLFVDGDRDCVDLRPEAAPGLQMPEAGVRGLLDFVGNTEWRMVDSCPLWN